MTGNRPVLGITLGEATGIGGELFLRTAPALTGAVPVAFASVARLHREAACLHLPMPPWPVVAELTGRPTHPVIVDCPCPEAAALPYGTPDAASGRLTVTILQHAAAALRAGQLDGVVTLPLSKTALKLAGSPYHGHTEFFRNAANATDAVMAFVAPDGLRIALATIHEPLTRVPELLTAARLEKVITLVARALRRDFGIAQPHLGVLGLNPHAGEDGLLGSEEQRVLIPLLDRLRSAGLRLDGPLVPDVAFRYRARYDLLLALYHDQGLIPFKLLTGTGGVNVTLGLPFVRTSVAHGTAADIAGTGNADPSSFRAAWDLAAAMVTRRAAS